MEVLQHSEKMSVMHLDGPAICGKYQDFPFKVKLYSNIYMLLFFLLINLSTDI